MSASPKFEVTDRVKIYEIGSDWMIRRLVLFCLLVLCLNLCKDYMRQGQQQRYVRWLIYN